ncbi:MAG: serine/threonine protein phosphatase [Ignavibacteriaceae bacterium]|nr:serine/threonine protein phosphatase [Ignavibacteriaceae bacterium]
MIAVIGDIHGCFFTLNELVKKVRLKYPGIQLYSVGDLVDRGNFSFEVIEFIQAENIIFTAGNHDYMFLYFFNYPKNQLGKSWIFNGADQTILSYKNRLHKIPDHLKLIARAPLFLNLDDCFISHAGISSNFKSFFSSGVLSDIDYLEEFVNRTLESPSGILWSRESLLNIGKLQIVGHTRREEIYFDEQSNSVYIDTSAVGKIKLSAVIVDNNKVIDSISVPTFSEDVD